MLHNQESYRSCIYMYVLGVPIVPLFSLDFSIEFWNFSESEVFSFHFNAYILYVYINIYIYILKVALSTIKHIAFVS
jgi:cellulose synthase/poly-beta-1,6-N-acetylglucosamine synthase-like glycosyltransferase